MKRAELWKRVLHEGVYAGDAGTHVADKIRRAIIVAPIIVDTRATKTGEDGKAVGIDDASNLSIPFPMFWLEGTHVIDIPFGTLIVADQKDGKYLIDCSCFIGQGGPIDLVGRINFRLDSEGNKLPGGMTQVSQQLADTTSRESAEAVMLIAEAAICDTLQLLGCKNVDLETRDNDPKQVRIAHKRHGDTPHGYRYHVLVVRPAGARSDAPAQEIGTMPRHVCRGHFAEYGPKYGKGLLFGKYEGRFYVPPHLKGDKKHGVVEKDYEIRP